MFDSVDILSDQMQDLLVGPWQQSADERASEHQSYLVVIDALDEIYGEGGSAFLRDLLETIDKGYLRGLKFLVTSRPDPNNAKLCSSFKSDTVCRLHEVPTDTGGRYHEVPHRKAPSASERAAAARACQEGPRRRLCG